MFALCWGGQYGTAVFFGGLRGFTISLGFLTGWARFVILLCLGSAGRDGVYHREPVLDLGRAVRGRFGL